MVILPEQVARKAKVFDMDVIGCDPCVTEQEATKYGIRLLPQEKVLQYSDFLSLHAPLNRYTKHMINQETLSQMKPGAILINTARGPLVDEQALREAVLSGHIAGAWHWTCSTRSLFEQILLCWGWSRSSLHPTAHGTQKRPCIPC